MFMSSQTIRQSNILMLRNARFYNGRITLTGLKEIGWEVVEWIHLAQDKIQWQAFVNRVMDLHIP